MNDDAARRSRIELSEEEMRRLGYRVVDILVEHLSTIADQRVANRADRPSLEARLMEPPPRDGMPYEDVLRTVLDDVFGNTGHVDHPRFFAYVPGPGNFVGVMGDTLAAGFNIFAGAWMMASGPAELELVTIDWLRQICGLPETAGGTFLSGGSMANLTALVVARHSRLGDDITGGTIYYSDQTHSSIDRALRVLGIDDTHRRRLPTDRSLRMPLDDLRARIHADREAGLRPFCVVANAGTTSSGAVDPLAGLATLCREEGLWLHVDGAYGAAAMLTERGRALLAGIEQADSLTLDPHKWFFQPFEIGCVLLRDGRLLKEVFRMSAGYLRDSEPALEEVNFRDHGIQLTRSLRALKLWMSFKVFGLDAFREAIDHGLDLAEAAERRLRASDHWEIVTPAQLGLVSFHYRWNDAAPEEEERVNRELPHRLFEEGYAMVSSTVLMGRTVQRLCTINPRTTVSDIDGTIARLEQLAGDLIAEGDTRSAGASSRPR